MGLQFSASMGSMANKVLPSHIAVGHDLKISKPSVAWKKGI
jgi:hypothetical protein